MARKLRLRSKFNMVIRKTDSWIFMQAARLVLQRRKKTFNVVRPSQYGGGGLI